MIIQDIDKGRPFDWGKTPSTGTFIRRSFMSTFCSWVCVRTDRGYLI